MRLVAVPTLLLSRGALPPICVATGRTDGVAFSRVTLREPTPAGIRLLFGEAGDTLPVAVPLARRPALWLRFQPLIGMTWIILCVAVAVLTTVELETRPAGLVAAGLLFLAYRWWSGSLLPLRLVDYDARVTVLAVARADVAAAIEAHVQGLTLPPDLLAELAARQGALR